MREAVGSQSGGQARWLATAMNPNNQKLVVLQEIIVCAGHKPLPPSNWCSIEPVVASGYQLNNTKNDSEDTRVLKRLQRGS